MYKLCYRDLRCTPVHAVRCACMPPVNFSQWYSTSASTLPHQPPCRTTADRAVWCPTAVRAHRSCKNKHVIVSTAKSPIHLQILSQSIVDKSKGKFDHTPLETVGGCSSPFLRPLPLLSVTHGQCDARPTVTFTANAGTKFIQLGDS